MQIIEVNGNVAIIHDKENNDYYLLKRWKDSENSHLNLDPINENDFDYLLLNHNKIYKILREEN